MVRESYNHRCACPHNIYHHDYAGRTNHNHLDDYQHRARGTDLHLDRPRD